MVQYEEYLKTQKPGVDTQAFKGTQLRSQAVDHVGNVGTITTTVPIDVPSGDADDCENAIANHEGHLRVAESFKQADGRAVSKQKQVRGVFQAAALGHPGAQAACRQIVARNAAAREAAKQLADQKQAEKAAEQNEAKP